MSDEVKPVTQADIDAARAAAAAPPVAPPPLEVPNLEPPELKVTLKTGQTYSGKDYEELVTNIARAQESASEMIERQKAELEQLRRQPPVTPPPVQQPPAAQGYDHNRYLELFATDGLAAQEYLNSYSPSAKRMTAAAQELEVNKATSAFYAKNPDFPSTPEAGSLMAAAYAQMFGDIPITPYTLKATYEALKESGALKPVQIQETTVVSRGANAPPAGGSGAGFGGGQGPAIEDQYRQMSTAELDALARRMGMK